MNDDQADEQEVLLSIYEDDTNFKQIKDTVYCYKFISEENELKSIMIQITWPKKYPESENAVVDLNSFFNSHIKPHEKVKILGKIRSQYDDWSGMAMTFNIINYVTDNLEEIRALVKNENVVTREEKEAIALEKKEKEKLASTKGMTKGQKRRFYDKYGNIDADDKPRGWDWVDVIKHLSKTGAGN
ncbi:RWD domain-containing protein 4-like isoform X2 [Bolinopsis microptera]|uniref:RWD domain-containing protein 4-like isoform X2 n=1 Tax=Bolinopsis microptera TaxID=2820187 RepID=UPI003078E01D